MNSLPSGDKVVTMDLKLAQPVTYELMHYLTEA